jgi:phosphohistidine phosphatase
LNLYIVRHAWAEQRDEDLWPDDSLRPLTKKGQKRFEKFLKQLAEAEFAPQLVATSPYVRCRQTAELLAEHVSGKPRIVTLEALTPGSDLAALIHWTTKQTADEIAWVGHAPCVGMLAGGLIGSQEAAINFAKGSVACIEFLESIAPGAGELKWLATADLLGV